MKKLTKSELNVPGVCLRCNTSENREWFLDTDIYLDYIGNLYFCNNCMDDILLAVGAVFPAELESIKTVLIDQLNAATKDYTELSEALNGLGTNPDAIISAAATRRTLENASDERVSHPAVQGPSGKRKSSDSAKSSADSKDGSDSNVIAVRF